MTESEWLAAAEPQPMLEHLRCSGKLSDRKLRLFACASCRHIWSLLVDERSRKAVEVAERYADEEATEEELEQAFESGMLLLQELTVGTKTHTASDDATATCQRVALNAAEIVLQQPKSCQDATQAVILRCLFGNPFRAPPAIAASLLKWADGTVVQIATAIYQERRWGDVAVLADALEDAGCDEAGVLEHLRGGGPHCRGCHCLDLILGRT